MGHTSTIDDGYLHRSQLEGLSLVYVPPRSHGGSGRFRVRDYGLCVRRFRYLD
jgi:hypothetical protein